MDDGEEAMARSLEASGNYKVLRRVPPLPPPAAAAASIGIVLDTETTGLDPSRDAVLELAMLKFEYDRDGMMLRVMDRFTGLQEPTGRLTPEIANLTGLSDADLAGRSIDDASVEAFASGADAVIAHNARFDRAFAEARWPVFRTLAWGCSIEHVPWREWGFEGTKLKYLLTEIGLFHDAHRAMDDCVALLRLLTTPLPASGSTGLSSILNRAFAPSTRVWALGAPYAAKEALRRRGYQWSDGSNGAPRAWSLEVEDAALDAEVRALRREVYRDEGASPLLVPVTALDRFSQRGGVPGAGPA